MSLINNDIRIKCIPSTYFVRHLYEQAYCILSYFTIPHANLALAESIILGTPTIAADTPESREYSLDGRLASLFKINDIEDFNRTIERFIDERPQIMDNLKQHSKKIEELFDPKTNELS